MATKYNYIRDINGYNGFGLPFTDTAFSATIAAATDTTVTVPGNSGMGGNGIYQLPVWLAIFRYEAGANVWVSINTTAIVPVGATFLATSSVLLPDSAIVQGGDVIHFITTTAATDISVRLYSIS